MASTARLPTKEESLSLIKKAVVAHGFTPVDIVMHMVPCEGGVTGVFLLRVRESDISYTLDTLCLSPRDLHWVLSQFGQTYACAYGHVPVHEQVKLDDDMRALAL